MITIELDFDAIPPDLRDPMADGWADLISVRVAGITLKSIQGVEMPAKKIFDFASKQLAKQYGH